MPSELTKIFQAENAIYSITSVFTNNLFDEFISNFLKSFSSLS